MAGRLSREISAGGRCESNSAMVADQRPEKLQRKHPDDTVNEDLIGCVMTRDCYRRPFKSPGSATPATTAIVRIL